MCQLFCKAQQEEKQAVGAVPLLCALGHLMSEICVGAACLELELVKQGACLGHQAPLGSCPVPAGALLGLLHAPQLLGGLGSIPVPRLRAALLPPGVRSPFLLRSLGSAAWKGAAEQGAVQESQTSPQQSPFFFFCISVRGSALLWLGRGCLSPLRPHGWCAEGFYQSTFKLLVGCKAPGATSECCWQ